MTTHSRSSKEIKTEWTQAAEKAREAAGSASEMLSHAVTAIGEISRHVAIELRILGDDVTMRAGVALQNGARTIHREPPHSGVIGRISQVACKTAMQSGTYLERAGLSGMAADLLRLVRRHPVFTVAIAIGIIWFWGFPRRN